MINFHPSILSCSFVEYPDIKPFENVNVILQNLALKQFIINGNNKIISQPLLYTLFGSKDLLILSENHSVDINNKLLVNHCPNDTTISKCEDPFYGILQNISGYTLAYDGNILQSIESKLFVAVTQFKLNSAYLFSGGIPFIKAIINEIDKKIADLNSDSKTDIEARFILSYSTYELCLITFSDNLADLQDLIFSLREYVYSDCFDGKEFLSFYKAIKCPGPNAHNLFSDTQTVYGVKLIKNENYLISELPVDHNSTGTEKSKNSLSLLFNIDPRFTECKNIEIDIFWKIKPGYFNDFVSKAIKIIGDETLSSNIRILSGKTDINFNSYFTTESYVKIFEAYHSDTNFSKIIRSIISSILYKVSDTKNPTNTNDCENPLINHIKQLSFSLKQITEIDNKLKERIGLSDNLRYRIMKMFHLYNAGISSTVTFNIYIDLYLFLKEIQSELDNIIELQSDLAEMISIHHYFEENVSNYEKAYYLRMIQNLSHDGSEVLINFNTSLPGFTSNIDSLVKLISSQINFSFSRNDTFKLHSVVTILDYLKTKSSRYFANFDLTSSFIPGLLFSYISKEVYVLLFKEKNHRFQIKSINAEFGNYWLHAVTLFFKNDNSELENISTFARATLEYFFMDYLRFKQFFNSDFKLFTFWYNATILQVSTNYEQNGRLNEKQWFLEILRHAFIYFMSTENYSKNTFLELNPFASDHYKLNNIIWSKLAEKAYNLISLFLQFDNNYVRTRFIKFINGYNFDDLRPINPVDIKEFNALKKNIFEISPTSSNDNLIDLGKLSLTLVLRYFMDLAAFFNYNISLIHDKGCTDFNILREKKINDKNPTLFVSSCGGFWFRTTDEVMRYNKINFEYMELITHLAIMYKMSTFLELVKVTAPNDEQDNK